MVDISHKGVPHMVQQSLFDDSTFNVHLEKSKAKILIWEARSSERMRQGCITSSAPKVRTLKYQTPPALLWSWSDKNKTSRHGFETLGPFARADQTHAIVGSLCQNAEILLLCALIGNGPVEGKGTHSHSDCQTDETEQRHHYIPMFISHVNCTLEKYLSCINNILGCSLWQFWTVKFKPYCGRQF